ncbi:DUF4314 domain-containing protein [Microbacterium sp. HMWF026]|uniref:DUF4314 domain-containing protein n=1 Tax=Microbacterium sp. HMWF026 TaxID=2056861 RepID=UPI00215A0A70|nr:DUF4314 domain-containing protein [Microbacterium sp. HMWF026]
MTTISSGTRIRLISTTDDMTRLCEGDEGTVDHTDSIGTVHVDWDNGSTLGLIPGEDRFIIL